MLLPQRRTYLGLAEDAVAYPPSRKPTTTTRAPSLEFAHLALWPAKSTAETTGPAPFGWRAAAAVYRAGYTRQAGLAAPR